MFRNYLAIAIRNLLKHKGYSAINVMGLAIGMASCVLIMLYIQDELNYDQHHKKKDRIYRLVDSATIAGRYLGEVLQAAGVDARPYLQLITDIHLHSNLEWEIKANSDIRYVYIFSCLAVFVAGAPVSYYAMQTWLDDFPYRAGLDVWILGCSGIVALAIAWITVACQSYKAATANPAEAIKAK